MRHLRSILYALVLAPACWTLCAVGLTRDLGGRARGLGTVETLSGLLLLLLAGAAYAILLLPRLSPAGPALAGLVFLGVAGWVLVAPASFDALWPAGVRKDGFDLTLPGDGLAALLAVPLLCTALSGRRWRGHDHPATGWWARPPFGGPAARRAAGFEAIGLGSTGDATQVLRVGRPEEATQVIPPRLPSGYSGAATTGDPDTATVTAPVGPDTTATVTASAGDPGATPRDGDVTDRGDRTTAGPGEQTVEQQPTGEPAGTDADGATEPLPAAAGIEERTQVIAVRSGVGSADDERTQDIGVRGAQLEGKTQDIGVRGGQLEGKTQVISAAGPDTTPQAPDGRDAGTRLTPVRPGERISTGTVTPPAEKTQVLGIPPMSSPSKPAVSRDGASVARTTGADSATVDLAAHADGPTVDLTTGDERPTTDLAAPDERPTTDLAALGDRPTGLVPEQRGPDDQATAVIGTGPWRRAGAAATTESGGIEADEVTRPMTVGGLERPADETADDTARRTDASLPRQPAPAAPPTRTRPATVPAQRPGDGTADGVLDDGERTRQL